MKEGPMIFISNDLKKEVFDYFSEGHTCAECDRDFVFPEGTTHDVVVERWKKDKERAERRRKERNAKL